MSNSAVRFCSAGVFGRRLAKKRIFIVRWIGGLSLALVAAMWCACHADVSPGSEARFEKVVWRRTADGWERRTNWQVGPAPRPSMHPIAITAMQLVAALGLLVQHDERATRRCAARD